MQLEVMWMLAAGLTAMLWMLGLAVRDARGARAQFGDASIDRDGLLREPAPISRRG